MEAPNITTTSIPTASLTGSDITFTSLNNKTNKLYIYYFIFLLLQIISLIIFFNKTVYLFPNSASVKSTLNNIPS